MRLRRTCDGWYSAPYVANRTWPANEVGADEAKGEGEERRARSEGEAVEGENSRGESEGRREVVRRERVGVKIDDEDDENEVVGVVRIVRVDAVSWGRRPSERGRRGIF